MIPLIQICETTARWLNESSPQAVDWPLDTWEQFKLVGRVHGVAPLLHTRLASAHWLPPSIGQWLAEQHHFNDQRLTKMHAELKAILGLFDRHDIPLMPLKGSILSVEYYEKAAWRPMADVDLLIRPDDLTTAAKLLRQLGYEQTIVHWKHTEFVKPDNRRVVSKMYEHPDNPRGLEIHLLCRETFGGPTIDLTKMMWQNASVGELLGEPAMLPQHEALWLHLLLHATYHVWQGRGRLIHLVDLVRLMPHLSNPLPFLDSVEARFTYPALVLVNKFFSPGQYDSLLMRQTEKVSTGFSRWANTLNLVNTSYLNPQPEGLYLFKALRLTEGRPREVLQALRFALLPSPEELALDHPYLATSKVAWLAYLLLPLDWVKRTMKSAN